MKIYDQTERMVACYGEDSRKMFEVWEKQKYFPRPSSKIAKELLLGKTCDTCKYVEHLLVTNNGLDKTPCDDVTGYKECTHKTRVEFMIDETWFDDSLVKWQHYAECHIDDICDFYEEKK